MVHVPKGDAGDVFARGLGECDRFCKVRVAIVATASIFTPIFAAGIVRLVAEAIGANVPQKNNVSVFCFISGGQDEIEGFVEVFDAEAIAIEFAVAPF